MITAILGGGKASFGLGAEKLVKWAKAIRPMQVTVKMGNIKFEKCPLYP